VTTLAEAAEHIGEEAILLPPETESQICVITRVNATYVFIRCGPPGSPSQAAYAEDLTLRSTVCDRCGTRTANIATRRVSEICANCGDVGVCQTCFDNHKEEVERDRADGLIQ
jgi:hypothetical protein